MPREQYWQTGSDGKPSTEIKLRYDDGKIRDRNGRRAEYAVQRFEEEGIRYMRPDATSDRFIVWSADNGRRYQFYAGTGLIMGPYTDRGIENMIMIAKQSTEGR